MLLTRQMGEEILRFAPQNDGGSGGVVWFSLDESVEEERFCAAQN